MPQLDILPYSRTENITMGAILEDEATVIGVGKYFPEAESAFQERLYLVYGDQKTCSLMWSCQRHFRYISPAPIASPSLRLMASPS